MTHVPAEITDNQNHQNGETGLIVFIALAVLEFGSSLGFSPVLSKLILDPLVVGFSLGRMINSFLIFGFILGIIGFLTYSKISLVAGIISSVIETFISSAVILRILEGQLEKEMVIIAGGLFILAITGSYFGLYAGIIGMEEKVIIESKTKEKPPIVLELHGLKKYYDMGTHVVKAVDGLNLNIHRGEMVAIMGPSGSGKSTLLNLIGLLDSPTSGKIILDGQDISKMDQLSLAKVRNAKIGFVFQSYNLINRSTVLKNVILPSIVNPAMKKRSVAKAEEYLSMLGLEAEIPRKPKTLSGGQQQRVAIARALMNDPSIILADEPTGNLDTKSGAIVMEVLKQLNQEKGITVIIVTHDREIGGYTDRIISLRDGQIENIKVRPNEIK
ncbi:MAG: ABC transporter ATP-binding protein [Candidatus Odinarchaeota archaeon]